MISVSKDIIERFSTHLERTQLGVADILRKIGDKVDMDYVHLARILGGKVDEISDAEYQAIMEVLTTSPSVTLITVTQEHLDIIENYLSKGLKLAKALQHDRATRPKGIDTAAIMAWVKGEVTTAPQEHLDYVVRCCAHILTERGKQPKADYPFTDDMREQLQRYIEYTNIGIHLILRENKDKSLTPLHLDKLLKGTEKTTVQAHIEYVFDRYEMLIASKQYYVALAEPVREIKAEQSRTGVGVAELIKICPDLSDIGTARLHNWIAGASQNAYLCHIERVLEAYDGLPDTVKSKRGNAKRSAPKVRESYGAIPAHKMTELKALHARKLLPSRLYQFVPYKPEYPAPSVIGSWVKGTVKTANPDEVDFVLETCREIIEGRKKRV